MKIYLVAAQDNRLITILQRFYALTDTEDKFSLAENPEEADAIVFVETVDSSDLCFSRVTNHPFSAMYPEKVFLYNECDYSCARVPALCTSAVDVPWQRPIGMLPIVLEDYPIAPLPNKNVTELMSFVGARSSRVRKQIFRKYESEYPAIFNTKGFDAWHCSDIERKLARDFFIDALQRARFSLCPRGLGTTSLRLYESMQAARCPVILADAWREDIGVDWSFAVRVPEKDYDHLPDILSEYTTSEALERGREGRLQWERAYAPHRYLHTMVDGIQQLLDSNIKVPKRSLADYTDHLTYVTLIHGRKIKRNLLR